MCRPQSAMWSGARPSSLRSAPTSRHSPDHQAFDDEVKTTGPLTAQSLWRLRAVNKTTGAVTERRGIEKVTFNAAGLITLIDVTDLD